MKTVSKRNIHIPTILLLFLTACTCQEKPKNPPNVLLIVVDTLRSDALGCYGSKKEVSPAVDALAARGVLFKNCTSQAPWTPPSVATILSGLFPPCHGTTAIDSKLPPKLPLLSKKFSKAGYTTVGIVSHHLLGSSCGFNHGFDLFDESNSRGHKHVSSKSITDKAIGLLRGRPNPLFLFLHYFDPHYNYVEHEGFTRHEPYDGPVKPGIDIWALRGRRTELRNSDLQYLRELYEGEIRFVDHHLGRLFEFLRESGLHENTLVVLTADHGEEFMEHGWIGHTRSLYRELLWVPLIIAYPGRLEPGIREDPVMLVDLLPTIVRLAGLPREISQGQDLFGKDKTERFLFSEVTFDPIIAAKDERLKTLHKEKGADKRSIQKGRWKAIQDRKTGAWELYDIIEDPDEVKDLAPQKSELLATLQKILNEWRNKLKERKGVRISLSAEDREKLIRLGYLPEDDKPEDQEKSKPEKKPPPPSPTKGL